MDLISITRCTTYFSRKWNAYPVAEAAADETAMAILSVWGWKAMQRTRACVVVVIVDLSSSFIQHQFVIEKPVGTLIRGDLRLAWTSIWATKANVVQLLPA